MRLIDADKLKKHYTWLPNVERDALDEIVNMMPTVPQIRGPFPFNPELQELPNVATIELKNVPEPKAGQIVLYWNENGISVVEIIDGQYYGSHGLSNFWRWKDVQTGKTKSGYGNFYEAFAKRYRKSKPKEGNDQCD